MTSTTIEREAIALYNKDGYVDAVKLAHQKGIQVYLTDLGKDENGCIEYNKESDLFVIDNNVEITSQTPSIYADITYKSDSFSSSRELSIRFKNRIKKALFNSLELSSK